MYRRRGREDTIIFMLGLARRDPPPSTQRSAIWTLTTVVVVITSTSVVQEPPSYDVSRQHNMRDFCLIILDQTSKAFFVENQQQDHLCLHRSSVIIIIMCS
eukprot:TRINITY_DN13520_c0_g1_i1.p1 TRINITY_DN13520_c0_g1~~TRINITY_DN13520_c0_g1_i1.p1  ORF type:complete len:101 (+),score=20.44 TRINITY_DN13520_c0_g1_i1:223-525(+)